MLKALSNTCWATQANAVQHVRDNFICFTDPLEALIKNNKLDAHNLLMQKA